MKRRDFIIKSTFTGLSMISAGGYFLQNSWAENAAPDAASQKPLTLATNHSTRYSIVLANDAIPAEKNAAQQFQKYFQEITQAAIPIVSETELSIDKPQILIGAGARVKSLLPQQNWDALSGDGIIIKTVGERLILAGDRPRGTLYAVYEFLEEMAGCRWFSVDATIIPKKIHWDLAPQNITYVPPFSYREDYTIPPARQAEHSELAVALRNNGHFYPLSPEWGGHYSILGFVHTFSPLLPPEKYFHAHPEWYSDPQNGGLPCTPNSPMPDPQHTQLCVTDPDLLKEFTKNALGWVEKNPAAGYISISENDFGPYCKCANCVAFAKREGSESGPILNFVNQVADAIGAKYPEFRVMTLAYHGTLTPPKTIRPRKNVIIRMAPIDSDYGKPLNSVSNASVRDHLEAWADIAPRLFIWNYVTNFTETMLPHPNLANWANDLRFFQKNRVRGIYQEGDYSTFGVGDFVYLRAWLMGKLMWNPEEDQDKLIGEFLHGYYQSAAPYLKSYLQLIDQSFQQYGIPLSTFNHNFSFLTLEVMNKVTELFAHAEDAVSNDPALTQRVQRERVGVQYAWIKRYPYLQLVAQGTGLPFKGAQNYADAVTQFIQDAHHFNVRNYKQNQPFSVLEKMLKATIPTRKPAIPDFLRSVEPDHIFDLQENVFKLWKEGVATNLIDDPDASNGKAVEITGNAWDVEIYLNEYGSFLEPHRWHCYACVQVDIMDITADAMNFGIYDYSHNKYIYSSKLTGNRITQGKYQWIDFGNYDLTSGESFYFQRLKGAKKIRLDRIVLVKE